MLDTSTKRRKEQQKQRVKKRYNVTIDPENYLFIPAKKQADYYDNDVHQRVAIYVRVSTDDVRQTTSYELQKKYYEEFVTQHPNWTLVKIYADEGTPPPSLLPSPDYRRRYCRPAGRRNSLFYTWKSAHWTAPSCYRLLFVACIYFIFRLVQVLYTVLGEKVCDYHFAITFYGFLTNSGRWICF